MIADKNSIDDVFCCLMNMRPNGNSKHSKKRSYYD